MYIIIAVLLIAGFYYYKKKSNVSRGKQIPAWVDSFIIYYTTTIALYSPAESIRDNVMSFANTSLESITLPNAQDVLSYWRIYSEHEKLNYDELALNFTSFMKRVPGTLRAELAGYYSVSSIMHYLEHDGGDKDTSREKAEEISRLIGEGIERADPEVNSMLGDLILFKLKRRFKQIHGVEFGVFNESAVSNFDV